MYNEMVVLKLVQSMTKLIMSPPEVFKDQIHEHFRKSGEKFYRRIKSWMELSEVDSSLKENVTSEGKSPFKRTENFYIEYLTIYTHRRRQASETRVPSHSCFKRILLDVSEFPGRFLPQAEGNRRRFLKPVLYQALSLMICQSKM